MSVENSYERRWIQWARRIQALSQSGLHYSTVEFERERYAELRDISVEILSAYSGLEHEIVADLFADGKGYETPKVDVRGAVFRDDKILLVQEKVDGRWALPGGFADVNLTPACNVEKEIREEAGVNARVSRFIGVLDRNAHVRDVYPFTIYKLFFLCEFEEMNFNKNSETLEARFFSEDDIPELSRGRTTEEQIQLCFSHYRDPSLAPVFD